jgi:hypothetical protein
MENQPDSNLHINPNADAGELISLAQKIIERHGLRGNESPLKASQIADLNYKAKCAQDKHEEGLKYKRLMDAAWRERDILMGLTPNTLGLLQSIVNLSQALHESYGTNRKELSQWGFDEHILDR